MTQKVAYIWGPVTSFNGPLAALLVMKGWHVHFACKSSLNLLSLSPLDLRTQAQTLLDAALGGRDKARAFKDRLKLVDPTEALKNTNYDAIIFGALPPNFDESRSPRAPWSGADFMGRNLPAVRTTRAREPGRQRIAVVSRAPAFNQR
jgi:hypothetical protein